jgi:hypothetical protein
VIENGPSSPPTPPIGSPERAWLVHAALLEAGAIS